MKVEVWKWNFKAFNFCSRSMVCGLWSLVFALASAPTAHALFDDKEKTDMKTQIDTVKKENEALRGELDTVKADRENILKQAKAFMQDRASMQQQMADLQGAGSQSIEELQSLKKE